jgi:hypothetical protein
MSDRLQDPELRERFAEMKRVEASSAPPFAAVLARAQADAARGTDSLPWLTSVRTVRRLGWVGGLAAAAAIAALIAIPRVHSGQDQFEQAVRAFEANPALGAWHSPTDGLLNLPGSQLISTIPRVGSGQQ